MKLTVAIKVNVPYLYHGGTLGRGISAQIFCMLTLQRMWSTSHLVTILFPVAGTCFYIWVTGALWASDLYHIKLVHQPVHHLGMLGSCWFAVMFFFLFLFKFSSSSLLDRSCDHAGSFMICVLKVGCFTEAKMGAFFWNWPIIKHLKLMNSVYLIIPVCVIYYYVLSSVYLYKNCMSVY